MRIAPCTALLALLVGCTWVSEADYKERQSQLDNDGDGFARDGGGDEARIDCNDDNSNINPGTADPWYDGVDSNCDGRNDYDKDGDGYVLQGCQDYSDCQGELGFGDCEDDNEEIYPNATDTWYDGVDSNCDDAPDYDKDGDGSDSSAETFSGRDCNDDDPDVGPQALEIWYDGVDGNCDGRNDYDQDGDGWVLEDCELDTDCEGSRGFGDCTDTDALVHPTSTDLWYDDVDSNCDGAPDFDQDGDGFDSAVYGGADCDDFDADVKPGGVEDLADSFTDGDCDGSATSVALSTIGLTLTHPTDLRVGEHSARVYFSISAEELLYDTGEHYFDTAVATGFLYTPNNPGIEDIVPWPNSTTSDGTPVIASGHTFDVRSFDNKTYMCGATGLLSSSRRLSVTCYQLTAGGSGPGTRLVVPDVEQSTSADFDDVSYGVDGNDTFHAMGCSTDGTGTLQYLVSTNTSFRAEQLSNDALFTGVRASRCTMHFYADAGQTGTLGFTDEDTGDYVIATWDAAAAPTTSYSGVFEDTFTVVYRGRGLQPLDIEFPKGLPWAVEVYVTITGELWLRSEAFAVRIDTPTPAVSANLAYNSANGNVYVAWTDAAGQPGLAWGDPLGGGFTIAGMTADFPVVEATPWISETGYLFLGVLGETQFAMAGTLAP